MAALTPPVCDFDWPAPASRISPAPDGAPRELFEAMAMVVQTGQGPSDQIPAMGCSIKWA